jgi:16S rRNA A1518/A1519 N6-dimethyltransferase RsmA/KsgA/DIM1 with predicted DNA glycosylase/AP lyase activity
LLADKSKGQHFLKNPLVIQGIVEKANLLPTDTVRGWQVGEQVTGLGVARRGS